MEEFWKWMLKSGYVRLNGYAKKYVFNSALTNENISNQMLFGYMLEYINSEQKVYGLSSHCSIEENYVRLESFIRGMNNLMIRNKP